VSPPKELAEICKVSTSADDLANYGKDWSMNYAANPSAIVFPETIEEVQKLVLWARKTKTSLVPSGGRTGLSGAATATSKEVVVSFEKMNKILGFEPVDRTLTVQAGVVTEAVHKYAEELGQFFPVDFAAKGSSQIGGNVATNVGGVRVLRYGSMRSWVSGLTVVTGAGDILKLNKDLVKNATGYDLKNLFVGSEGTLGLVVEVDLKLTTAPKNTTVLVLGMESLGSAPSIFKTFRNKLNLSACEFFSEIALKKVLALHNLSRPFESETPFYLLLEVEHQADDISESLFPVFEECCEAGWVSDGVISQSATQAQSLWNLREFISESLSPESPYKNDISVKVSQVAAFSRELESTFKKDYSNFQVVLFGHIGDGNVHVNILKPNAMEKSEFIAICHEADKTLFAIVEKYEGAVSAEHGVGLLKKEALHFSRSAPEIELMKTIKRAFDPDGILNPGKVFDA